jgi:formylglycine-generating enzyme required for sulfatase activity
MVYVAAAGVCLDRYEASPVGVGEAASVADVMPWTSATCDEAAAACQQADKRLCEDSEWTAACQGATLSTYPYGDTYNPTVCNGSGHTAGVPVPTGSMSLCEGGYAGLHDLSGNVAEWTAKSGGSCNARGGSFTSDATALRCDASFSAASTEYAFDVGFRCCRAP